MRRSPERVGRGRPRCVVACAAVVLVSTGCGSDPSATPGTPDPPGTSGAPGTPAGSSTPTITAGAPVGTSPGGGARCVVRLHGKGGTGGETFETDGVSEVFPTGNADGWGARQWLYFPDDAYVEARDIVAAAATEAGCTRLVLNGFSNGAAFAAKLWCRGETFDGRLVGVVIDDPVPDNGVAGCSPSAAAAGALYWTGGLESDAQPDANCESIDWTCEGGTTIGIEAYAASLGLDIQPSPFTEHEWYVDAPEIGVWLAG